MRRISLFGRWDYLLVLTIGLLCVAFISYPRSPAPPNFATLFPDGYYTIKHPSIQNGSTITVNVPPDLCTKADRSALECFIKFIERSLPSVLSQFGIPEDQLQSKADKGLPLLANVIALWLGGDDFAPLTKRSIWSDIGDIFGDIGCAIAVTHAVAVFLYSAAIFSAENNGLSIPISDDQNFFIYPVHGDIATSGPVRMFYQATRSVGFNRDSLHGTTFNRDVYTVNQNARTGSDPNFAYNMRTVLLHELTHVLQYKAQDYNLNDYAFDYCWQFCKDGYPGMPLEAEAFGNQNLVDDLLQPPGLEFYQIWSSRNLEYGVDGLGFPIQRSHTTINNDPRGTILELEFQYGLMQIIPETSFRIFNSAESSTHAQSQCSMLPRCHGISRRHPDPNPLPPDGHPPVPDCDPDEVKQHNAACSAAKAAWAALDQRSFTPFNVPPPPPPPPPGCPTSCQLYAKVPRTSHSCQFQEPPPGCDWEFVDENNAECRKQRAKCGQ